MKDATTYRVSVPMFEAMIASGVFGDDRVELLDGVLTMMTTSPPHDHAVIALGDELSDRLPRDRYTVREEKPVIMGRLWRPVPDVAVVRGDRRASSLRTPRSRDIGLVVEVSDTTYPQDAGKKLRRYQRCGIPVYWIVDLNRRRVEVYEMSGKGLSLSAVYHEADRVPLRLDGQDYRPVPVAELLL